MSERRVTQLVELRRRDNAGIDGSFADFLPYVTLAVAAALLLVPFYTFPFTESGVDSQGRDIAFAMVLAVLSAARIMAPATALKSAVGMLLVGVALIVAPVVLGPELNGRLSEVWLLEVASGLLVTVAGAIQVGSVSARRGMSA